MLEDVTGDGTGGSSFSGSSAGAKVLFEEDELSKIVTELAKHTEWFHAPTKKRFIDEIKKLRGRRTHAADQTDKTLQELPDRVALAVAEAVSPGGQERSSPRRKKALTERQERRRRSGGRFNSSPSSGGASPGGSRSQRTPKEKTVSPVAGYINGR
jgi:hypothetical protein